MTRPTLAELLEQTSAPATDIAARYLPAPEALADLLPGGGLRCGTAVEVDDPHLLLALAGAASPLGWHAAIGLPETNWLAGAPYGLRLEQMLLIDQPGERWVDVLAGVLPGVDTVLLRPPGRLEPRISKRIGALLRRHDKVLIVAGHWPGSTLRLTCSDDQWHGLGDGHGLIAGRETTITVTGRGSVTRMRSARLWLPDGLGQIRDADGHAMPAGARLSEAV
jgi:hypothetical protein